MLDVAVEIRDDHVSLLSSGVAFGFLLALAPTIAAVTFAVAAVADPDQVAGWFAAATSTAPPQVAGLVSDTAQRLAEQPAGVAVPRLAVSVLVSLWVASSAASRLVEAVEVAYDVAETRSFWRRRALAFTLCAAALCLVLVTAAALIVVPKLLDSTAVGPATRAALGAARFPVLAALFVAALAALYRWAPDRPTVERRRLFPGAVTAALLWLPASASFGVYTTRFASPNTAFGPLAAVIVAMLWLYLTAFSVLVGAEVNASLERGEDGRRRPHVITDPGRAATVLAWALERAGRLRRR